MADLLQPVATVAEVYPPASIPHISHRYAGLKEKFLKEFGFAPSFAARAPGRVNLIGEHIDYSGYSVLPMALEQDTIIMFGKITTANSSTIKLRNLESGKYPAQEFKKNLSEVVIDSGKHQWSNYFLAGYKGMLEHLHKEDAASVAFLVHGTVPQGSGLSSSSALVCASALATLFAQDNAVPMSPTALADLCCKSERYIGTMGGGMDQAISFLASRGTAKLIEFDPLRSHDVHLPDGVSFVIAHSMVEANKYASTFGSSYNMRVIECRLATAVLGHSLCLPWRDFKWLRDLQHASKTTLAQMLEHAKKLLKPTPYSRQEVAAALGLTVEELHEKFLKRIPDSIQHFELQKRAVHVFSEAKRVVDFKHIADQKAYPTQIAELGALMNESHQSCNELFECSCPELNQLTSICRAGGAVGSRLTGAGWGGASVALVRTADLPKFLAHVRSAYYSAVSDERIPEVLFATAPGSGAAVFKL